MVLDALFDFRFKRRGGPAIVRLVYGVTLAILTIGVLVSVIMGVWTLEGALEMQHIGEEAADYALIQRGKAQLIYWIGFLTALLPVYIWTLIVNRVLAEFLLAVFRSAAATEALAASAMPELKTE